MAAFNLTAQLNLKGPSNVGSIVSSIKNQLGNISTTVKFTLDPNAAKNVSQLDASLKSLNQTFKDTQQSATAAATAISKFTSAMSQGNSVGQYSNQLNQANQAAKNLSSTQAATSKAIEESSSSMQEFGKQAGLAVRRFAAFSSVTSVIYGLVNAVGKGTSEFISFDKEFVKLQQVTGESAEGLKSLGRVITGLSAGLGTSSAELVDIASTLAQAGLSARDTEKALKALALSSLAPSFDSMNETVEGSIALMRQFDISATDLEKALGAVNSVAAKFAVEASDIITAIQRTGGVFATASKGVSEGTDALNEFIAVFTSVRATTRESAETIATGLRTIFTRIQRESTIDALKEYGVSLQNLDGKFVGAYKAVELLSQGLSRLDPRDVKFSKIIEELGGFRQIGKVIPLIQEFATAQQALSVAQQGQGSLATDAAKAQLSLANQIAKTREEFLALFRDIGSSNTFQTMVTGALQLTSALIKVVGAAKGLLPMFTAIAAVQGAKAISRFAGGLYEGLSGGGKDSSKKGFATGGLVPGVGDADSVPAMLTPGEFVVRKAAVKAMGVNKLHSMNKYASGGSVRKMANGGALYDEIEPQLYASSNKQNAGKIKVHDGDSIETLVDPTQRLVDKRFTLPDRKTPKYPKDNVGGMLVPTTSRLLNVDAFEVSPSKNERTSYPGGKGPAFDSNREKGQKAKELTLQRINELGATKLSRAFKKTNEVDISGRPMLDMQNLSSELVEQGLAKESSTSSLIQADTLANRKAFLAEKYPKSNRSEWEKLLIKDYQANYRLDGDEAVLIRDKLQANKNRILYTKTDSDFMAAYESLPYKQFKKLIEDDYQSAQYATGGRVQKFADGGVAQRKVGYIDYDVIANPDNEAVVKKGMEATGMTGPRLYTDYLTQLAVQARKENSLDKLRAIYGVAGSGKTTLARGQGTDSGTLRQTERFPVLSPEDIQRATEVLVLSSSVSKDKLDSFFGDTDRTYTLSSTTKEEREGVRSRRVVRDISGIGLENRKPGSTTNVATDTAVGEALLSDRLGNRSTVLGRSESGRLRRKRGDELVDVIKKKIGFSWGGFAPMTAGHESIMDAAAAMGIAPEDFIYLVGSNEGVKPGDPSSYRTAVFDQDFRMVLAKAGAGSRGATVLPKPRDFEVPQAFDISQEGSDRRTVLLPKKGSRTFVADKGPEQTKKYKEAGYAVSNIERSGGISGTMVRDLIMAGDMGKLQEVLSPNVYEIISNNIGRLQNRANALPEIIEQVQKSQGVELDGVEKEIKAVGITRIDNKKAAADPEYAAKVQALQDLRDKRDKIKSSASFEPYRILAEMARKNPEKYGLDLRTMSSDVPSMRTMSSGKIQQFIDGGWVQRMQSQKKSTLKEDLKFLQSAMVFSDETGSYVPTYAKENEKEVVDAKEMLERYNAMSQFITGPRSAKSGLKPTGGYNPQELLDAVTYYQAGSGPLTRAMVNNDFIFTDRNEAYDTEDLVGRLSAASQYKLPKKLYSGFGRGQFNEILKDTNTTADDLIGKRDQAIESLVGQTVDFPTFLSTSVNPTVAEGFVGDPGALFSIDASKSKSMGIDILKAKSTPTTAAPPESRRLPGLDKIKQHKLAGYDQEKEFILQPNSQFKILSAKGKVADSLKETLTGIKKNTQKSSNMVSDTGEEFTVFEPDYENDIAETLNAKTRINIQAQMLASGGKVQRFAEGGRTLSPLLQSIYDTLGDKPEWLKEFGLPDNVTTDVPAKTIAQLYSGRNFPTDPSFGILAGKPVSIDNVNAVWRKSFSPLMGQEKTANYTAARNYLAQELKDDTTEQTKLTIRDINKSTKLGIVGLQPTDKKAVEGPMSLGGKNVTLFIAGLSSQYDEAVRNMRRGVEGVVGQFGSDMQDAKIFGSSEKYAFDFDETLVTGADILDANGKPDIPRYGDINAVRESMKGAKLTQLGEKVKKLMALDPSFIKKARILTARPQMTAGILSDTLQGLGLPFQESDITGVSQPVGDGGLNIVDEKTKRINNSIIAKAKAQDVRELEALIDDNLQNVTETKKAGKKAFHYTELRDLTQEEKAASGFPNIEGAITQSVMTVLGATGGLIQNGAVDYENGLGPAAQYFPGIGSDWPTEVKRTLDSDAISDAKKEFTRYYKENGNKGILAQAFASGGLAEAPKKEKEYGKIGLTEDGTMINAGYFKNDTRSGYATAYKMRDYLYYVGLSSATSGYGPKLYDVLMEAATEKGAMLTSDRSLVSGDAQNVWEYYFNNRSDVQKTPLKPSDWTRNNALIDPKLYGKEETWPPANDPAWILQSGYSKSPSIINGPDVVRSSAKVDYRALMSSFFSEKRGSSEPVTASNSDGEEFTVGYSKMAAGGRVKQDELLSKYKDVIASIMPQEYLSKDGLLRLPSGEGKQIQFAPASEFSYTGFADDVIKNRLEKVQDKFDPQDYKEMISNIDQIYGGEATIKYSDSQDRGGMSSGFPHEVFHDIQSYLTQYYPDKLSTLQSAVLKRKEEIVKLHQTGSWSEGRYPVDDLFLGLGEDDYGQMGSYPGYFVNEVSSFLSKKGSSGAPLKAARTAVKDAQFDLGRMETIPQLLSAIGEGDNRARSLLGAIFAEAGLSKDFSEKFPQKFAAGGMVPGVGNGDTVPAMLNVGDFVIRKSSVNSIGPDKLASMAGYASGGSVSDKVPALLTPGEFVFSKTAAQKIGYPKLHSMNKVGKFASGGAVGLRMGYADGGTIQDLGKFLSNLSAMLNNIPNRTMSIRPDTINSSTTKIDDSTTQGLNILAEAIKDLGFKASETAALVKRGGDISYQTALKALEADLERAKIAGSSYSAILGLEDNIKSIREKSIKTTTSNQFLETAFSESQLGQKGGSGAAQQKIAEVSDRITVAATKKEENKTFKDLKAQSSYGPSIAFGKTDDEIRAEAKKIVEPQREKIRDESVIRATKEVTGVGKGELKSLGIGGSDIQKYISQSMLDRKTLAEADKQLLDSKLAELKNSKAYRDAQATDAKAADQMRQKTIQEAQKQVGQRREVLDPMAKQQGLPGLKEGSITESIAGIFGSGPGIAGLAALASLPGLIEAFGPATKTSGGAAFMGGFKGAAETASAGVTLAGQLPFAAGPILAATAIASLASAAIKARNAFIEFEKEAAGKQLEISLGNLQQLFVELGKDIKDVRIQSLISTEIQKGTGVAKRIEDFEASTPKAFYANSLDALFASTSLRDQGTGNSVQSSSERSKILEKFGTGAYYRSTGFGQANFGLNAFGADARADENRRSYLEMLAPEEAQERAKRRTGLAEFSQQSIFNKAKTGQSASDIIAGPDYDALAKNIALANNMIQLQVLEIERSTIADKEAAKNSLIRAYADEQVIKITKQIEQERQLELAERAGRQFSMSFDRMFANMNQSIMEANNTLDIFTDKLDASIGALGGQASIGKTRLDTINVLKTPNISSDSSFSSAASSASSLFGTENKLVESILVLGRNLETSLMSTINGTIKNNPRASDTKISLEIEKSIEGLLDKANLPSDLSAQLSKSIGIGISEIRKKEGEGTKDRKIDFSELLRAVPGLKDTVDTLKNTNNSVISALENYQSTLDRFTQKLELSGEKLREAADRRFRADDIVTDSSLQLARTFGTALSPSLGSDIRDKRTARLTGGVTSPDDILLQINQLQNRAGSQRDNLNDLKNRSIGQPGAVAAIIDNEKALSRTNYQLNQTYTALKNLADSSEAASNALSAIQAAQQRQSGKVSLIEKLVTSGPEELDSFNKALVRLQRTAGGENFYQTADQRKEILSVLNDITPLMGSSQEANNFKANTLENLLKTSGIGLNPQFESIINSVRNPQADPAIKEATEAYKKAVDVQSEANNAMAKLSQYMSEKLIQDMSRALEEAINKTRVKFDDQSIKDIVNGIRSATTVVAPGAPVARAEGGLIYAANGSYIDFQPKGTDTVPAMLTPGEFVVNRQSTSENLPLLQAINKSGGGKISYFARGGSVDNDTMSILMTQMKLSEKLTAPSKNVTSTTSLSSTVPFLKKSNDNEISSIGLLQSILKTLQDMKESSSIINNQPGKNLEPQQIVAPTETRPVAPTIVRPETSTTVSSAPSSASTLPETIESVDLNPIPSIPVPNLPIQTTPNFEPIPTAPVDPIVPDMPTIPEAPLPDVREPISTPEDIRPRTIPQMPVMPQPEVVLPKKPAYEEPFPVEVFPPSLLPGFPKAPMAPTYEKGPYGFDSPFFDPESVPKPRRPLVIGEAAREAGFTKTDALKGRDRVAEDTPESDSMIEEVEARKSYNKARRAAQSAQAGEALSSGIGRANGAMTAVKGVQEIKEAQTSYEAFRGGLGLVGGIGDIADSSSLPLAITGDAASLTRNTLDFYNTPETRLQSGLGIANDATSLTLRAAQATSLVAPAGSLASQVAAPLGAVGAVAEIGRGAVAGAYDTSNEAKLRTTVENIIIGAATGDATTGGSGLAGAANAFGANIQQGGNTDLQLSAVESQLRGLTTGAAIGTAILPGPGTAIGAVAGQGVAATGELYKSGSAYIRESAQAQQLEARTDQMLKSSKTQEYMTGEDGNVTKQSKNPDSFGFGLDVVEENLIRNVAGLTKEISTLRVLQEQGHTTFNNQPIEEAIYGKERSLYAGRSDLKSVATRRANDENTTLFDLGPNSPLVKSKIDRYQSLIGRAIEELGDTLSEDIKPDALPKIDLELVPDLTGTQKQSATYASNGALFTPRGTDTIPAMLTPGEFVMSKSAVDRIGVGDLNRMNKGYQRGGAVSYYADGGYVSSSLQDKYLDAGPAGLKLKRLGTFSLEGDEKHIDLSELPDTIPSDKEFIQKLFTAKNLQVLPNLSGLDTQQLDKASSNSLILANRSSTIGYGVPSGAKYRADSSSGSYSYESSPPDIKIDPIGDFFNNVVLSSILKKKPIVFEGTEAEATDQFALYKNKLDQLTNFLPKEIKEQANGAGYDITNQSDVAFKIKSASSVLSAIKTFPSVATNGSKASAVQTVRIREMSKDIEDYVGLLSGPTIDTIAESPGGSKNQSPLPDLWIENVRDGFNITPKDYGSNPSSRASAVKRRYGEMDDDGTLTGRFEDRAQTTSFMSGWIQALGKTNTQSLTLPGANIEPLKAASDFITPTYIEDLKNKKLIKTEALYESAIFSKLQQIIDGTQPFVDVGNDYFDLTKLGSSNSNIRVTSVASDEWLRQYAPIIKQNINNSKDKNVLEKLSYYGKDPTIKPFDIVSEDDPAINFEFGWMDNGLTLDKATEQKLERTTQRKAKGVAPNITRGETIDGSFKINDLDIPYQIPYTKYEKAKWWDTRLSRQSDESILDPAEDIYLLDQSSIDTDPLRGLNTGDKRAFASLAGIQQDIPSQISTQLNRDAGILQYLTVAKTKGYDSDEAKKLEDLNLDNLYSIKFANNLVGSLTKANAPGGFGDQFTKTGDIFDGEAQFYIRDYIIASAKRLSETEKIDREIDSKKKGGPTRDTKKLLGFDEGKEFASASLALVLGAEELFGTGGEFELPGILPPNWFKPVLPRQFNSIYDMPQGLIREGMGRLSTWLNDASGRLNGYITPEMSQKDGRLYDTIVRAQNYMRGARLAFTSFQEEDTSGVKTFFDPDLFKGDPTPNGNPEAIEQAIKMFQSMGRNDENNPAMRAISRAGQLTPDKKKRLAADLKDSKIDNSSGTSDTTNLKDFDPSDLEKDMYGQQASYKTLLNYALNPYNQYTNRDIRANFFDEFISRIFTATELNGAPLFSATTGARFGGALRSLKSWFGGKGNDDAMIPPEGRPDINWQGIDYLYDQTADKAVSYEQRFDQLQTTVSPDVYASNRSAFDYVGGRGMFGELPSLDTYEKKGLGVVYKNNGGLIYASEGQLINFQPRGTDTVPAMLTPGEFVVNASATSKNLPLLKEMNRGGEVIYRAGGSDSPEGMAPTKTFDIYSALDINPEGRLNVPQTRTGKLGLDFLFKKWTKQDKNSGPLGQSFGFGPRSVNVDMQKPEDLDESFMQYTGVRNSIIERLNSGKDYSGQALMSYYDAMYVKASQPKSKEDNPYSNLYDKKSVVSDSDRETMVNYLNLRDIRDNKLGNKDRSWLYNQDRDWSRYFRFPTGDEYAATVGGALQSVLPSIFGLLFGTIGAVAGGAIAGPLGGFGGAVGLGAAGGQLGMMSNQWIIDNFLKDTDMYKGFSTLMKENPSNVAAGQTAVLATDLALGVGLGHHLENGVRPLVAKGLSAIGARKTAEKALYPTIQLSAREIEEQVVRHIERAGKKAGNNGGEIVMSGGRKPPFASAAELDLGRGTPGGARFAVNQLPGKAGNLADKLPELAALKPNQLQDLISSLEISSNGVSRDAAENNVRLMAQKLGISEQRIYEAGFDPARVQIKDGKLWAPGSMLTGAYLTRNAHEAAHYAMQALRKTAEELDKPLGHPQVMEKAGFYLSELNTKGGIFPDVFSRLEQGGDVTQRLAKIYEDLPGDGRVAFDKLFRHAGEPVTIDAVLKDIYSRLGNTDTGPLADALKSQGIYGFIADELSIYGKPLGGGQQARPINIIAEEAFRSFRSSSLADVEVVSPFIKRFLDESGARAGAEELLHELNHGSDHGGSHHGSDHGDSHHIADNTTGSIEDKHHYSTGGVVYANRGKYINFQPKGTDTVPAMLTPGEFVINARSTAQHLPLLKAINSGTDVSLPNAMNTGGVVYLVGGGRAPSGMTPAGAQAMPRPLTRQQKANRTSSVGTPPRIDSSSLDPDTGEIVWTMVLKDRIYTVLRDSLQKSFKRLAESGTSDSYEDYNNTLVDFKELQYQMKQNVNKYKAGDYGESVTYLQSLKREYEIAARTGSVGGDQRDWRAKKQPTQQQGQQQGQPQAQQNQQQQQASQDPRQQAQQERREKNDRVAEAGMAPRIDKDHLDPVTGAINWPMVLKDSVYSAQREETEKAFRSLSGSTKPVDQVEYQRMQDVFAELKNNLKQNVDKYNAGDYGESRTFLDSLNREYDIAAKGGGVGGNKPDWRKPRQKPAGQQPPNPAQAPGQAPDPNAPKADSYDDRDPTAQQQTRQRANTDRAERNARIAAMGAPPRINEDNLDPVTGNISWPMVLTDGVFSENRTSIQSLFSDIASKGTPADMDTYQEGLSQFKDLKALMKENVNNYNAGDYGSSRTFVDSLESEFIKAAKSGYIGGETPNWRKKKDDQAQPPANETEEQRARREKKEKNDRVSEVGQAPRIDPSFLDPVTGQVRWTMALTDPAYSSNRDDIQKAFSDIADGGFPVEYDQYEKTNTDFQEFKNRFKENVNNYSAGDYGESRTYLDSLHREYDNAAKGGGVGGDKPNWRKPRNFASGGLVYSNNQALQNSSGHYASGGIVYANNGALIDAQASGTDTVPAMLTPGEFVVNRNSAQKFMPVLNAINGGAYSAGGIVNYLANGGFVQPHYLSRGNENPIGAMSQISNSSGVLNNSVGQNMVMAKPAWVDEFIGQAQEVSKAIGNALTDVTSQLNSVGSTMTESAQKLANTSKTLSETKFPEEIVLTHSGNIVTDMLPQRVNEIVQRSIDTSVAISNNNIDSAMASINRGIMKDSEGAMGKTG